MTPLPLFQKTIFSFLPLYFAPAAIKRKHCKNNAKDLPEGFHKHLPKHLPKDVPGTIALRWRVALVSGFLLLASGAYAQTDSDITNTTHDNMSVDTQMASEAVRAAIFGHPGVQTSQAKVCQALYSLGLSRATKRPRVTGEINGAGHLTSNFNRKKRDRDFSSARGFRIGDDRVFDLEVTLRQTLYDWQRTQRRITAGELRYAANRLELSQETAQQLYDLTRLALRADLYQEIAGRQMVLLNELSIEMTALEAQGAAGVIRLADVRRARLILLDTEIKLQQSQLNAERVQSELASNFELSAPDISDWLSLYRTIAPEILLSSDPRTAREARILSLRSEAAQQDFEEISAERYPQLSGVLEGTLFDLRDYEDEFQMIGRLEFSMPLYDGGSNKARRQEARWRVRELETMRAREIQDKRTQLAELQLSYSDGEDKIHQQIAQRTTLENRLMSLRALIGREGVTRFDVMQALVERADIDVQQITTERELEGNRLTSLFLADQLASKLAFEVGENRC